MVRTHDECKHAIARLESTPQGVFGFDTERVAYIREHASQGATSDKAAIAQIASSVVAVIFILHEWPICYFEFKQFMESSAFKKAAVCIRQDATALRNRFPHITPDGCVEILQRARRAFPELPNHKVGTLSRELLGRSMDKRMDHRFWEARWYTARQLRYAKLDAVAHRMIELVVSIKEGGGAAAAAAPPAPSTGDGGVPDLYEASDDEFDDPGLPQTNEACTRHRTATPADDAIIDDDSLIPGDTAADEPTVDEPTATTDGPTDKDAVEPCLLKRCKDVIDAFAADPSSGTYIALPSSLSVAERKQLHHYADQWGLHHRSATRDGQRQLMILRWLPFAPVTAAIARAALGSTVMMSPVSTENNPAIAPAPVRGVVVDFDPSNTNGPSWTCRYDDNTTATVQIDELNIQLQRRVIADFGSASLSIPGLPAARVEMPAVGGEGATRELEKLLDGCDENWATSLWSYLGYDIKHWITNFASMCTADKHSRAYKAFLVDISDCVFKIRALDGGSTDFDRVYAHARRTMTQAHIARLRRKYWRTRCRYHVPEPRRLVRDLYDLYCFYKEMDDPSKPATPGQPEPKFFSADSWSIFLKEIKYVQEGLLSDLPGVEMYLLLPKAMRDGTQRYRCMRSGSAIEGHHLHYRLAQHPGAKGRVSPRLENACMNLFDLAFNICAGVKAGVLPDLGHFEPWWNDAAIAALGPNPNPEHVPPSLRQWHCINNDAEPICKRGILWDELDAAKDLTESSPQRILPLRTDEDVAAVMQHPEDIIRRDVASIERKTGLRTTARHLNDLVQRSMQNALAQVALTIARRPEL